MHFLIYIIYSQESIEYCNIIDILLIMLSWVWFMLSSNGYA